MRKKKDLELQILTEPIRNWEGDDIKMLGPVLHMSQAAVNTANCQVRVSVSGKNTPPAGRYLSHNPLLTK